MIYRRAESTSVTNKVLSNVYSRVFYGTARVVCVVGKAFMD